MNKNGTSDSTSLPEDGGRFHPFNSGTDMSKIAEKFIPPIQGLDELLMHGRLSKAEIHAFVSTIEAALRHDADVVIQSEILKVYGSAGEDGRARLEGLIAVGGQLPGTLVPDQLPIEARTLGGLKQLLQRDPQQGGR